MPSDSQEQSSEWSRSKRIDHAKGRAQLKFWREHGCPSGPFYSRCLECGEVREHETVMAADHDVRYHAGVHGGLEKQHAEIVVTDDTGRELFRHHALHTESEPSEGCPTCGEPFDTVKHRSCPECGRIQDEYIDRGESA
jgi:hypothetical protein